jgi:Bacterial transcriptional activator domain
VHAGCLVVEDRLEADVALGRDAEAAGELERLVAEHPVRERLWRLLMLALYRGARVVTLTGAGGVGKTRLAVEFAMGVAERFPDGVWLADLAGITDPGLVPAVVMEAVGVRQDGDVPVIDALRWRFGRHSCCWCWTTASTCWMRARSWRRRCCPTRQG